MWVTRELVDYFFIDGKSSRYKTVCGSSTINETLAA
jgi:hypothetical protein